MSTNTYISDIRKVRFKWEEDNMGGTMYLKEENNKLRDRLKY